MKLTKILLEYPGAFTPRPEDEWEKNQEDMKERGDPAQKIEQYIENGSVGDLDLSTNSGTISSLLTSLPDNLTVNGNLLLHGCEDLTYLPKNLYVKGSLDISFTKVNKLPYDINIGENISAEYSALKELPDNFTVNGGLNITATPIKQLPKNLKVQYNLFIDDTMVSDIPYNLEANNFLCSETPLANKYTEEEIFNMIVDRGGFRGVSVYS